MTTKTTNSQKTIVHEDREWQHGDHPEQHPMWDTQLELEYGMMRSGADKLRDQVISAKEKKSMTDVGVVNGLMLDWVPSVADMLKETVRAWKKDTRVVPKILPILEKLDPHMAALVGVREILDRIGQHKNTVTNIAMEIGRTIEHEQKVRLWAKGSEKEAALWALNQKTLTQNKATSEHRRRVNINRFHHYLEEGEFDTIEWTQWTQEEVFRTGWAVMDCVVKATGWFEVQSDPEHHDYRGGKNSPKLMLMVKQGLLDWLKEHLDRAELNQPDFRPTVMPPKPWTAMRNGGYWTHYVKPPRLIRFKASQEHQKQNAADEYDALDMPKVYASINMLQDTAYRVNKKVLEVFEGVWITRRWHSENASLPELQDRPMPPRTPRMVEQERRMQEAFIPQIRRKGQRANPKPPASNSEDEKTYKEIAEWKRHASEVYAFNARRASRTHAAQTTFRLAEQFSKYEAIYFPHMLDFRGRMYPIPSYLQPQGNDLARGLLTYADGLIITADNGGIKWLAIHLGSTWGLDKKPFKDRIDWVFNNEQFIRDIVKDPYSHDDWFHKADKPWQFLAACHEWVDMLDALEKGEEFYSCLPIMVDGTCNGIQHLSALVRDEVGGKLVNLTPSDEPQDIYKAVAMDLQETLENIRKLGGKQGQAPNWWLNICDKVLPRSLTKRQVMVLPYGGSREAFFKYTRQWLDENHPLPQGAPLEDKEHRTKMVIFLTGLLWDSVKRNVGGAERVMEWIQKCAKVAVEGNQPIFWTLPSGFTVRHFYGVSKDLKLEIKLEGVKYWPEVSERTLKLSTKEQLQGIAPNFVHSLDASCLVDTLVKCQQIGLTAFTSIHDAYGTHAANMEALNVCLREAVVETHRDFDVLGALAESCLDVAVSGRMAALSEKGKSVDPLEIREKLMETMPAPLDFGYLDLEQVFESEYFFS